MKPMIKTDMNNKKIAKKKNLPKTPKYKEKIKNNMWKIRVKIYKSKYNTQKMLKNQKKPK